MPISASIRRFALALTLALSLGMFVAALLGPSQTLAKAHVSTCSSTHPKAKCNTHACSHKGRARHASKCTGKHSKKKSTPPAPAARCEDASVPVRAASGSFSCDDGSEPTCENGATPTRSGNGKSLVCPVILEEEPGGSGETECEEGPGSCSAGTTPGPTTGSAAGTKVCEGSASEGSSALCEEEG